MARALGPGLGGVKAPAGMDFASVMVVLGSERDARASQLTAKAGVVHDIALNRETASRCGAMRFMTRSSG
jgi:hypothetical protein